MFHRGWYLRGYELSVLPQGPGLLKWDIYIHLGAANSTSLVTQVMRFLRRLETAVEGLCYH